MRKSLVRETKLQDSKIIEPTVVGDSHGFTIECFCEAEMGVKFVQDVHVSTRSAGVIRGLHFQVGEKAQTKLVRVTRGKIYQIIVDLRKDSPSYGKWEGFYLSEYNKRMLLIPKGFAQGYLTLTGDVDVIYKVDQYDDPVFVRGIKFDCPQLNIEWNYDECMLFSSLQDAGFPTFPEYEKNNSFTFDSEKKA